MRFLLFEDMLTIADDHVHTSVLLDETLSFFEPLAGKLIIDATVGLGGHSEAILKSEESVNLIGFDQDAEALALAAGRLAGFGDRARLVQSNFSQIVHVLDSEVSERPDGILADLGVSSLQFDSETRGFSFRFDAPLDMRMDATGDDDTATDLLAGIEQDELADLIYRYGEERHSRKIAKWIVERRKGGNPIRTTFELAELVKRAVPKSKEKIHPATRTFQALRIAVNKELEVLKRFVFDSIDLLKINGVLAVITFHSLEDRIVKHAFQRLSGKCQCPPRIPKCVCGATKKVEILTRKPILPSAAEQEKNPRSRSAKLRACRKLEVSPKTGETV